MGKTANSKKGLWKLPSYKGVLQIPRKTEYRIRNAKNKRVNKTLLFEPDPNVLNENILGFSDILDLDEPSTSKILPKNLISGSLPCTLSSSISSCSSLDSERDENKLEKDTSESEVGSHQISDSSISKPQLNNDVNFDVCDEYRSNSEFESNYDQASSNSDPGNNESPDEPDGEDPDYLDKKLYADSSLTTKQSLLLTMAHIIRFQESKEATASLLKLLSFHMPCATELPSSLFCFYKHFEDVKSQYTFHMYCAKCSGYVGLNSKLCTFCHHFVSYDRALEKGNYFLVFEIEEQIKNLLHKQEPTNKMTKPRTKLHALKEGYYYQKLPMEENDLSITWNTDGVPVFHSSDFNIWPLLYTVNEIGFSGQKNVQLAALWFGNGKPDMNSFLKPFVDQMNKLSSEGFKYDRLGPNKEKVVKVFPGPLTCDSVARCTLQNLNQFNGAYGCNWCLNEGKVVSRGEGHARIYEVGEHQKRDASQMKRDAKTALQTKKPVNGVKGFSVLMLLRNFNIVEGFVVDYMHSVCQGVVKATSCMWFDSSSHHNEYYLGRKIDEIDGIFLSLKPIDEVTRTPRTIKDRKQWKANEWRSWLLFYSPVILREYLPVRFYNHWLNLVLGVKILLSAKVSPEMIVEASNYLRIFVEKYGELYGNDTMTFNVHLLLHLHETVTNWGPLWAISCFQFENMNGKLMKLFNGTQKVPHQIREKFAILSKISIIAEKAFLGSASDIQDYFYDLLRGYPLLKLVSIMNNRNFAHGLPKICSLTDAEKLAFQPYLNVENSTILLKTVSEFQKITTFGQTICSHEVTKRSNCGIKLKDGSFGIVQGLYRLKDAICNCVSINCACSYSYFAIFKELRVYHQSQMKNQIFSKCKITPKILASPISDIKEKVLILGPKIKKFQGYIYIVEMPNFYECD